MITRAKAHALRPTTYNIAMLDNKEPGTYLEALEHSHWKAAMNNEYQALLKNNTWTLIPLPLGKKLLGCKWVFKLKRKLDGSIARYKARLVAKGFNQVVGFDFSKTFSLVVKPTTIRIILSIDVSRSWKIRQLDVNNAFLNGDLQEEIFMTQPPSFERTSQQPLVCKLNKTLYGLKQASRAWFLKLKEVLQALDFHSSTADNSLFYKFGSHSCIILLIYVDDILVTGSND